MMVTRVVLLLLSRATATAPPPPPPLCAEAGDALRIGTLPLAARDGADECSAYGFATVALDQNDCVRFGAENALLVYAVSSTVAAYVPPGCTRMDPWTAQDRLYYNNPSDVENVDHARYNGQLHLLCSCAASSPPAASPSSTLGPLIGAIIGSVVALCLVCVGFACCCVYCRRDARRDAQPPVAAIPPPPQRTPLRTLRELADYAQDAL